MPLSQFDPVVAEWFRGRFGQPTEPQVRGWPEIRAGRDVLISAPTGAGKTLSAFLICLDDLIRAGRAKALEDRTEVVYVSPLKALSNDIRKNLDAPLAEIAALAEQRGEPLPPIRASVRTGDTTQWERQQMLDRPPHVLVTTPESLFILMTAEKSRRMLRTARTVIVDEIHAVADDKRGSHLALTLARLDALVTASGGSRPQRIGLSATVKPIEEVADFLAAGARIVDVGYRRAMDLGIEVPKDELGAVATNEMWEEIYDRLAELIAAHWTTLVFVNTRRLSERVAHHLAARLGENAVLPHHGSLSRRLRLAAEQRLKSGELRAVVATASLELGIDIGTVDLACQVGSPRSIAVALQRIGRSGHWVGALPKGRLFATTRDELLECIAVLDAIRNGELDRLEITQAPLDILAQQIVAAAASEEWAEDDLYALARATYSYRALSRKDFDAIVEMLSEGISTRRGRSGALLHRDQVNGRVKGRRGARLTAITSGGAIPDNANYIAIAEPEGVVVGTLDEDFAVESMAGDVFLLGTTSWRIRRIESGFVRVEDAHGAAPSIPFWRGEAPGRTRELSEAVSRVREHPPDELLDLLPRLAREQAIEYVAAGRAALGAMPSSTLVVAERFFDESGGMQLVIHAPFGSRINRAWGLALRKRFCRSFNLELQAAATDNGIVISLTDQHAFPLEAVFEFLHPDTVEDVLTQALLASPMFGARWRWNASRALAIPRFLGGRKIPAPIQRMRSDDLMAAVFPDQAACGENLTGDIRIPDHPLVNETIGNCLYEAMDLPGLKRVLAAIRSGEIRTVAVETAEPSPFSHETLNANPYAFLDDAPLEERRTRAVQMRRTLGGELVGEAGALDPKAIAEVEDESWPLVRDADELHDALLTLVVVPPAPEWQEHYDVLRTAGRAGTLLIDGRTLWTPAERLELARRAYPGAEVESGLFAPRTARPAPDTPEECVAEIVRGWMETTGPQAASALAGRLALPVAAVEQALARLEAEGQVLRGRFRSLDKGAETEWCNRRLLARIHRLTIGRLRREIEPVTTAEFVRFLVRWQHAAAGAQLHGVDGAFEVIRQLQGFEIPAAQWEAEILPRRVARYSAELLDQLSLSGEVMWGRLSPHPAFEREGPRRVRPTRAAPITLFLREDADWLIGEAPGVEAVLSHPARETLDALRSRGASFFADLVRATRRLPSEVEDALWELLAAGLVTADSFENLRALTDPKRRRGEGRGRTARPRHAAGRWALLRPSPEASAVGPDAGEQSERFARQLLLRWGVVFRDLTARETLAPAWRDLLVALRRLEARGEIRGGRFVAGFLGEQFARPEAVDLLRALRRQNGEPAPPDVAAADPLNLTGILLPGPRVSPLLPGRVAVM
ncbi:MAG: DEAD/DEAH box helicase [Bryobacteraceae bacterium]|nr:DEAD/DEAH box helicase [Bryobacteraceae bacterium]